MSAPRAAFVDRDGVIDALVGDPPESPLHAQDVALIPGAADALKRFKKAGWLLVGVSNQPAVAKGTATLEQLVAVHERVIELVAAEGTRFDAFEICWHHPQGVVPGLSGPCACRKPAPGMVLAAAERLGIDLRRSWIIGDTDADVLAGKAAGCHTVLVENPGSVQKRGADVQPEIVAAHLHAAADALLRPDRGG